MSTELKLKVLEYVDGRVSASASEVGKALDITVQRAGRYLKTLVSEKLIEIDHTQDHVPFYSSVRASNPKPKERVTRDVTEAHSKDTQGIVDKCMDAAFGDLVRQAEESGYNRGFAKGYAAGLQESQREAYEDGKKAVVRKLTEMLT